MTDISQPFTEDVAIGLFQQETEGVGATLLEVEFGSPDWVMLSELRYNAFVFSTFKNHSFMGDLAQLLVDEADNIRSFAEFRELAAGIEGNYYSLWLEAEYETALATGQMAARWQDFQKDKDIYPYLQYQTVGDDRVREEHRVLDGATYPVDDPFWDTFMPPNGWRCRCDVIQVAGPLAEPNELPEITPGFNHNPGSSLKIATEDHPYFQNLTDAKRQSLMTMMASWANMPANMKRYPVDIDPVLWRLLRHKPQLMLRKNLKGSYYSPSDGKVAISTGARFDRSAYHQAAVAYHEYGHAAHFSRGLITSYQTDRALDEVFQKCKDAIAGRAGTLHLEMKKLSLSLLRKPYGWELNGYNADDYLEMLGVAADTLEALTKGRFGWGHGHKYFALPNRDKMEWFAHASSNRFMGNPVFEELMPEVYDLMVSYIRSLES